MNVGSYIYEQGAWSAPFDASLDSQNSLIVLFADQSEAAIQERISDVRAVYAYAIIVGASTAGEIFGGAFHEKACVVLVMQFERTIIKSAFLPLRSVETSFEDGAMLARKLHDDHLKAVFVLSDGLNVNGSQLTKGMASIVGNTIPVTGGLAGDGNRFLKTWIVVNDTAKNHYVGGIGFYGNTIHFAYASKGGWDSLGLQRIVTKSRNNVLYELDHKPALEIYKKYLGDKATGLPATGLLFPLELQENGDTHETKVRTILAINEQEQSITFAGDIPEGSSVTLMKANFDRLIQGASDAAESIRLEPHTTEPLVSIAISCVGRRLVLKSRIEEELEAVLEALPPQCHQIGFYSYGEISPLRSGVCDLHNQTMTLTLLWESSV